VSTPVVKLGPEILGGDVTYGWDVTYGTKPAEQAFTVSADRVPAIPLGVPLTLSVENVRRPLTVQHVYALDVGAGKSPNQRVIRLADRRWLWSRKWVSSSFNVRRASGESSLVTEAGQPIELAQLDATIRYAKWSLDPPDNGAIPWTARRVLEFVMGELEQPFRFRDELPQIPVLDLVLEDNGAAAVERVLGYLPGADVYIDIDGVAVFLDATKGVADGGGTRTRDAAPVPGLERRHVGLGADVVTTSRKAVRPAKVVVLFTNEVEVRFDAPAEGATRTRDTPALVNVAPSPDLTLALSNGDTVARGTYVPLDTLFSTWGTVFGKDSSEALSHSVLADYGTAAGLLETLFVRGSGGLFSAVNGARVRAAIQSWRRLYQVDEMFMQRVSSLKATRVAVLNPTTGTRARSEAYCDFMRRPNAKNPEAKGDIEGFTYGWWGRGYATLLADAVAAPATVSVVNEVAGVIRIEPQLDPWSKADAIVLGYPRNDARPTTTGHAMANRTGVDAFAQWNQVKLTTDFQVATVLTMVPASPNTLARFRQEEVSASECGSDGEGPPVYVRVFPGVLTARYAWSDELGEQIRGAILRGDPLPPTQMVNAQDVRNAALAAAKEVYAGLVDTPDTRSGPVSVDMNPDLKPSGAVGVVRHGLNNGKTTTLVTATGIRRPADFWRFLDAGTRRTILRQPPDGAV
jgi:hypothetical protein